MSNQETTQLGGGSSTITISPPTATLIYQHQGRYIEAAVKMTGAVPIPDGATLNFVTSSKGNSANFLPLVGEPSDYSKVPIERNEQDLTQGVARLCIRHDPSDVSDTIVVAVSAGTGWGNTPVPTPPDLVQYTVSNYDPTITFTGPDQTLLQLPSVTDGDSLTPDSDNKKFTTHISCKVVDDTLAPAVPLSDYVVEWHEAGLKSLGIVNALMNTYTSEGATYADRLQPDDGVLIPEPEKGGYFVRMVTNAQGVADLYLVAKHSTGSLAANLVPVCDFTDFTPGNFSFLVVNATDTRLSEAHPIITVTGTDEDGPQGHAAYLDFDNTNDDISHSIPVTVNPYTSTRAGDTLYLIVNGAVVAGPYTTPSGSTWSWAVSVSDSLFYSDSGPNANALNRVLFVVVEPSGDVAPSAITEFYGQGDNQQDVPIAGPLEAPTLNPGGGTISLTWLRNYGVKIDVDLKHEKEYGWSPQPGDVLTATAYIKGWHTGGDLTRSARVDATPLTLGDISSGKATLQFPPANFTDWDSQDITGTGVAPSSICSIGYTVQPKGKRFPIHSRILQLIVNTANVS